MSNISALPGSIVQRSSVYRLSGFAVQSAAVSSSQLWGAGGGWDLYLSNNQLESLPANFGELEVGGDLFLHQNQLKFLPSNFGELEVGGTLWLDRNQLKSLPEGFENISVGGDLTLFNNQLAKQTCNFPNVQGEVKFDDDCWPCLGRSRKSASAFQRARQGPMM